MAEAAKLKGRRDADFWDDVNRTEKMGEHFVERLGINVFVREHEIKNWQEDPRGMHKVIKVSPLSGSTQYSLGSFYLSE
ncbi:hypothetical protein AA309_13245 [Microvirga vignae]|uniref:Uncharacterized protein n=1 Tax=Microvirga vignae TaxID=1225564 RepID=A0A0H1RBR0_9HYPH|nr:hypothetical protein [Microvirga vignae]KLK92648.1 hypothetical protein AA309_13245 [Microvirga vignae]